MQQRVSLSKQLPCGTALQNALKRLSSAVSIGVQGVQLRMSPHRSRTAYEAGDVKQ
jgi:hypothetical protein